MHRWQLGTRWEADEQRLVRLDDLLKQSLILILAYSFAIKL